MPEHSRERRFYVGSREIAEEWYRYYKSLDQEASIYLRFMVAWMAFNYLYNEVDKNTEAKQIECFVCKHKDILMGFDAFNSPWIEPFKTQIRSRRLNESQTKQNAKKVQEGSIRHLLLSIYTVRCNLFHGNKSPNEDRDCELVEAAWHILDGYLNTLLPSK